MGDEKDPNEPKNPYEAYYAQGFELLKRRDYERAIGVYTKALAASPQSAVCLLSRSYCFLRCGNFEEALEDVGKILKTDAKNPKAMLLQAEICYEKSDFENSLMIFHRGKARRPEIHQFTRGINKTSRAISNSCTGRENPEDLEEVDFSSFFRRIQSKEEKKKVGLNEQGKDKKAKKVTFSRKKVEDIPVMPSIPKDFSTCRRLMGELHNDRRYLGVAFDTEGGRLGVWQSTLTSFPALSKSKICNSRHIQKSTVKGAKYFDRRLGFWFQQEPRILPKNMKLPAKPNKEDANPGERDLKDIRKSNQLHGIESGNSSLFIPNGLGSVHSHRASRGDVTMIGLLHANPEAQIHQINSRNLL